MSMYIYISNAFIIYTYFLHRYVKQEKKERLLQIKKLKWNKMQKTNLLIETICKSTLHYFFFKVFLKTILLFLFVFFLSFFVSFHLITRLLRGRKWRSFKVGVVPIATVWASYTQLLEEGERVAVLFHLFRPNSSGLGRSSQGAGVRHGRWFA